MGIRKNDCKGEWRKVLDIARKVIGAGQQPYVLFSSASFIGGSHVCIVLVFLNIPARMILKMSSSSVVDTSYLHAFHCCDYKPQQLLLY
jgi:hypothetical protein